MTAKYQQLSSQVTTQTQIRNSEHLANTTKKPGSKTQTYAAVTAERLPIKHKPKSTPNLQPITQTKYPCTKYITTATILTTTEKKYTEKLELAPATKPSRRTQTPSQNCTFLFLYLYSSLITYQITQVSDDACSTM